MNICEWCKKEYVNKSHSHTRFCCRSHATKKQYSEGRVAETILARKGWIGVRNSGRTRFKIGHILANSPDYIKSEKIIVESKKRESLRIKLGNGKYINVHKWVYKKLGKAKVCMKCGDTSDRLYQWANRSREYKKDLTDWISLCVPCHVTADANNLPL